LWSVCPGCIQRSRPPLIAQGLAGNGSEAGRAQALAGVRGATTAAGRHPVQDFKNPSEHGKALPNL
jgi:hypothetical protein